MHLYHSESKSKLIVLLQNNYILNIFTENPCSKPFFRNVVYIPIIILNHATSHGLNGVKINHGTLQLNWTSVTS